MRDRLRILSAVPKPFLGLSLAVAVAAGAFGLLVARDVATVLTMPAIAIVVLPLVAWLAGQRLGWIALGAIGVWAIGGGFVLWIATTWGYGSPDSAQPQTDWIEGANGWLLAAYFLVVVYATIVAAVFGPFRQARGVDASSDSRWTYVVFVPAAVAVLLFQAIFSLHEFNYPG